MDYFRLSWKQAQQHYKQSWAWGWFLSTQTVDPQWQTCQVITQREKPPRLDVRIESNIFKPVSPTNPQLLISSAWDGIFTLTSVGFLKITLEEKPKVDRLSTCCSINVQIKKLQIFLFTMFGIQRKHNMNPVGYYLWHLIIFFKSWMQLSF